MGKPWLSSSVKDPWGVVLELASLFVNDNEASDVESTAVVELARDVLGESFGLLSMDEDDRRDGVDPDCFDEVGVVDVCDPSVKVTIFIPVVLAPFDGMNNVVAPLFSVMEVRSG